MPKIDLFIIAFNRPDLLWEQKRLLDKYLKDEFSICVIDNSKEDQMAAQFEAHCRMLQIGYRRTLVGRKGHNDALNFAAQIATENLCEYWMTLDHDVFPRRETTLIAKIALAGFYGIGQFHTPTRSRYLWPGFCAFSRHWLNGRLPNFNGIRGVDKRDDGDCGSMLHGLFTDEDWERMYRPEHGYQIIRPEDEYGLQSYGIEFFGDWIHLTNASHWMEVPNPDDRDRILMEKIKCL